MATDENKRHSYQLKLDFDPFSAQETATHFFPGGNRQQLLDQLTESCCYSSDLSVVTGSLGSGKSTLAQWLALSLDDDYVAVSVSATLFMSAEQLLESISEVLGLDLIDGAASDDLIARLDQYAASLRARSRTLLLLIDDAHELGEEGLQAVLDLLECQADPSRLGDDGIKVVLFGEPMLLSSIRQLVPSALNTSELEPLSAEEVVDYVAFKLSSAGYDGGFPLDVDAMTVIEARSRGNPGAIDALVKEELGSLLSRRATLPDLGFLEQHLVAASVVFGALILALFFTLGNNGRIPDDDSVAVSGNAVPLTALAGQRRIQVPVTIPAAGSRETQLGDADNPVAQARVDDATNRTLTTMTGRRAEVVSGRQVTPPRTGSVPPAEVQPPADIVQLPEDADRQLAEQVPEYAGKPDPGRKPGNTDRALLARSPDSYTLQLLGSHSEDSVKNFIAANSAPTEMSYFESRHQDRPWFVVVHGSYPDRSTAKEAIERLPPALRDLQPWARHLSDIQADIRKHQ